jgi:hypothetical protein
MNLRDAAALALVGWYLMLPPLASSGLCDSEQPLSKWKQHYQYEKLSECEDYVEGLRSHKWIAFQLSDDNIKRVPEPDRSGLSREKHCGDFAMCVASDDPRLKEK